ncbi:MAG: hypothetical protein AAGD07_03135 [Planctomycetota bacterium]
MSPTKQAMDASVRSIAEPESASPSNLNRIGPTEITGGCLLALGSAVVSCVLLLVNGAFVMALLAAFAAGGVAWITNPKVSQFLLFSLPVAMLVVQWMMIDYLRWLIRRSTYRQLETKDVGR